MLKVKSKLLITIILCCLLFLLSFLGVIRSAIFPVPVFAFHGVIDAKNPQKFPSRASQYDYSIQDLERVFKFLIGENYWFLSTQEVLDYFILKSKKIPLAYTHKKPILFSFDDGFKNIDTYLLPLLNKLRAEFNYPLKVVLFINPLQMQDDNSQKKVKYLKCNDLRRGMQQGFYDIQSHGYSHGDLTKMNAEKLSVELFKSQQVLQQCTEKLVGHQSVALHFAYPYNRANAKVLKTIPQYYLSGYGANSYFKQLWVAHEKFRIPRFLISYTDSPEKLIRLTKIHQAFLWQ